MTDGQGLNSIDDWCCKWAATTAAGNVMHGLFSIAGWDGRLGLTMLSLLYKPNEVVDVLTTWYSHTAVYCTYGRDWIDLDQPAKVPAGNDMICCYWLSRLQQILCAQWRKFEAYMSESLIVWHSFLSDWTSGQHCSSFQKNTSKQLRTGRQNVVG